MHWNQPIFFAYSSICYICRIFILKQSYCKYRKRLLPRCNNNIYHFKSDLIYNMGHMRMSGTEPSLDCMLALYLLNYSFEARNGNQAYRSGVGPILSVVTSGIGRGWSCRAGISQPEGRGRLGRSGFERGCIRDTARIQRMLIGDRYALQSERVIFYPIIPDQAIKIDRHWSGVGRLSDVNVALNVSDL